MAADLSPVAIPAGSDGGSVAARRAVAEAPNVLATRASQSTECRRRRTVRSHIVPSLLLSSPVFKMRAGHMVAPGLNGVTASGSWRRLVTLEIECHTADRASWHFNCLQSTRASSNGGSRKHAKPGWRAQMRKTDSDDSRRRNRAGDAHGKWRQRKAVPSPRGKGGLKLKSQNHRSKQRGLDPIRASGSLDSDDVQRGRNEGVGGGSRQFLVRTKLVLRQSLV